MKNKKLFAILTLVCFMFTLMPVAAFAGTVDYETSSFVAVDGDQTVRLEKVKNGTDGVDFSLDLLDADENAAESIADGKQVVVWAVNANGTVTSALAVPNSKATGIDNVYALDSAKSATIALNFNRTGEYTVYAGIYDEESDEKVSDISKFDCEFSKIIVKSSADDPDNYTAKLSGTVTSAITSANYTFVGKDGKDVVMIVPSNNVESDKVFVNLYDEDKKALKGATVTIETNSASIEVNKEKDTTNAQGQIDFKVSAAVEGTYKIILTVDGVDWTLKVKVGNTSAAYIALEDQPTAPLALYETFDGDVTFTVTDINGNIVTDKNTAGMDDTKDNTNGKYIVLTEAPADTDLESEDLSLKYNDEDQVWELKGIGTMDAEGTYAVKVILENGAYATAKWEVKKFLTPVMMYMELADAVELGKVVNPEAKYVDANGVTKDAKDAEFAATGYAVSYMTDNGDGTAYVAVKTDEKYAGTTFTVTAVSERYNLVATKDVKVAKEGVTVKFVDTNLEVNVNNKVDWFIADEEGTKVRLNDVNWKSTKYIVLDKPEDAKVTVYDSKKIDNGEGQMSLTSNKVGNVAVQVIVQYELETLGNNTGSDLTAKQTKYYTGTQIFAVGTKGVGDVVVMSIGSNEIIVNSAKATIDAAPMISNSRTFVPFRALAEAFGATVAYDEATQSITAELNGTTVVMTISSATYTVNGAEKTADVAPFINGSRTMVPVRFVAEAFGIKVIPTYDENGATADILFNL